MSTEQILTIEDDPAIRRGIVDALRFAGYRALLPEQRPQTKQEKIDQLAVRLSNATGRNLLAWFETFRFPLSAWVYDEVVGLPPWDTAPF